MNNQYYNQIVGIFLNNVSKNSFHERLPLSSYLNLTLHTVQNNIKQKIKYLLVPLQ
jgi:hypothetical protein